MSEVVRGVVVAHSDLAQALVRAVEAIAGVRGALVPISNEGVGPEEFRRRIEASVGDGPAIIFVDLSSGSCAFSGRLAAGNCGDAAVLTGVSLPMLLDFVFHREMGLRDLVRRLVRKAQEETHCYMFEVSGADRPVSH
ncbi:MAG: PTS sugar transporter subunit IIA [Gemmatimonadota bacterium]